MENKENSEEKQYPSVDTAFEIVMLSYGLMLDCLQAIESKIQGLLTTATAITVATPIFAKAINVNFSSTWFYAAAFVYVVFVILGFIGLRMGKVRLVDPGTIYRQWLHKSSWQFKKDGIYNAAQDFNDYKKLLEAKNLFRDTLTILLVIEIIFIVTWIISTGKAI
jgi:hypothetical protein